MLKKMDSFKFRNVTTKLSVMLIVFSKERLIELY